MLELAFIFFVISLIAGLVGFSGLWDAANRMAKIVFFGAAAVFVALVALALLAGTAIL